MVQRITEGHLAIGTVGEIDFYKAAFLCLGLQILQFLLAPGIEVTAQNGRPWVAGQNLKNLVDVGLMHGRGHRIDGVDIGNHEVWPAPWHLVGVIESHLRCIAHDFAIGGNGI